ncbi:MAG: hypothetical protein U0163_17065 [Gemmatimonadaceae bacterium]
MFYLVNEIASHVAHGSPFAYNEPDGQDIAGGTAEELHNRFR